MKDGFVFQTKYEEQVKMLSNEQAGILLRALISYQRGAELPPMDDLTQMAFLFIRQDIDSESKRRAEICSINRANGRLGGRPSKSLTNKGVKPKKPNGFQDNRTETEKTERFLERENNPNEKESTKEKDNTLKRENERKKEIDKELISISACTCAEGEDFIKTHEEIMQEWELSYGLTETLKDFLRHCFLNGHIVSNAKLEDIIYRLFEKFGSFNGPDEKAMIECVNIAIRGGYFDVKA